MLTGGFGVCGNVFSFDAAGSNEIPASARFLFTGSDEDID